MVNLQTDLRDGTVLLSLVSKLTSKQLQPPHATALTLEDKIENVKHVLSELGFGTSDGELLIKSIPL